MLASLKSKCEKAHNRAELSQTAAKWHLGLKGNREMEKYESED